jgi:hypothetical protein
MQASRRPSPGWVSAQYFFASSAQALAFTTLSNTALQSLASERNTCGHLNLLFEGAPQPQWGAGTLDTPSRVAGGGETGTKQQPHLRLDGGHYR